MLSFFTSLRIFFIVLSLSLGMFFSPAYAHYDGHLGHVNAQYIIGWAWDTTQPTTRIQVDLYDGTHFLGSVTADQFGQDLLDAGKGDGRHRFMLATPAALRNGETHTVHAFYGGTRQDLWDSPHPFTFDLESVRLGRRLAGLERTVAEVEKRQRAQADQIRLLCYHSSGRKAAARYLRGAR